MFKQTIKQFPDNMYVTSVQVATVWTNPESARTIDKYGTKNPTDIKSWINELTYETSLALCDENRIQTQLLYGEPVIVVNIKDQWAQVIVPSQPSRKDERGYPGWLPLNQLKKVAKHKWEKDLTAAITNDKLWLENKDGIKQMELSFMTLLPVIEIISNRIKVLTPDGEMFLPSKGVEIFPTQKGIEQRSGEEIVKSGETFLGRAYFWGGMSSYGYDCSGLSYATHKANGYKIPRDAGDQSKYGEKVPLDQLSPGDLLFFAYEEGKGRIHHVGIYYGKGKMLHAPQTGKGIEIITLKGTYYEKELCVAKRYW